MLYFLVTIISLLIGYFLGSKKPTSDDLVELERQIGSKFKRSTTPVIPTGAIPPKTAAELSLRSMPKEKREGLEAMRETLNNTPELKTRMELKKQIQEADQKLKKIPEIYA